MMKILVTGSRGWHDRVRIRADLLEALEFARTVNEELVVIHGDCPKGADKLAKQVCKELGIRDIPMPADWDRHKKRAGFIRNQEMLDEHDPDLVLAYRATGKSNGTDDMIDRANRADVHVVMRDARTARQAS